MMRFRAELHAPLPAATAAEFLARLAYVSEALQAAAFVDDTRAAVAFDVRPGREAEAPVIAARCIDVADTLSRVRRFPERRLFARTAPRALFTGDPHPLLEARGELVRYGAGRYGLGPGAVALVELFDADLRALAARMAARPMQFPALIGADVLARCRYFRSFPHSLTLVSHLREDLEAIRRFASGARWTGEALSCERADLADVTCLLAPAVCFHWYAAWQGRAGVGPHAMTAAGRCFRYEAANLEGLRRLWDFTMREIVFLGPADWVQAQRRRCMDESVALLARWGLEYEISTASDPFFTDDFAEQSAFQLMSELKFEVKATLPYAAGTLAVGSFNYHGDFFGKALDVTQPDGQAVHTGCVAFGLERLFLAFVAQHGVEPVAWPAAARAALADGDGRAWGHAAPAGADAAAAAETPAGRR
ncbi:MAG TPA: aminoacyl--tRNA ligase-related protein, partial [Methylomirabilota bacterium]|nr:aminoacyl--tRNA ligase-related protein [Methylomirabilota bacterium]